MPEGICPFAEWIGLPSSVYNPGSVYRVGFCDHTAGGYYSTLRSRSFWVGQGYSVHFAVARDGRVAQLVNIFDRAYGQGRLGPTVSWAPYIEMGRLNPNEYLISTEHEDYQDGYAVPGPVWTEEQYQADLAVKRWCREEVLRVRGDDLLVFNFESLSGHYMFDSVNRSGCPGNPWKNDYRSRLYHDLTITGDDVRVEVKNKSSAFLAGNSFNAGLPFFGEQGVDAAYDFGLPPEAKYAEIRVEAQSGFARFYSGAGNYCGDVGWGTDPGNASRQHIIIGLSEKDPQGQDDRPGKWFKFHADDKNNPLMLYGVSCIAYYT